MSNKANLISITYNGNEFKVQHGALYHVPSNSIVTILDKENGVVDFWDFTEEEGFIEVIFDVSIPLKKFNISPKISISKPSQVKIQG